MAEKRRMQRIQSDDREDRMTTAAFQRQKRDCSQPVRGQNGGTVAVCQRAEWGDYSSLSEDRMERLSPSVGVQSSDNVVA